MSTFVIYDSETGNTKKIANTIFSAIPAPDKDICSIKEIDPDSAAFSADTFYVGFWVRKGSCSIDVIRLLGGLHRKNIALFGTKGLCTGKDAYETCLNSVKAWIPDDNVYLGGFMCPGRMEMYVRNQCASLKNSLNAGNVDRLLNAFDETLLHPDDKDLKNAAEFALKTYEKTVIQL